MITTNLNRRVTSPFEGTSFGDPETYALTATFTDDGSRLLAVRIVCTFTSDDWMCDIHDALLEEAHDAAREVLGPGFIPLVQDTGPEEVMER